MSILVVGSLRIPADAGDHLLPYVKAVVTFSRSEDGCMDFSIARDLTDPTLLRIYQLWRDEAALAAHLTSPHMLEYRTAWGKLGVSERQIFAYEVGAPEEI
jgi:quinol monooxygenase YgiN